MSIDRLDRNYHLYCYFQERVEKSTQKSLFSVKNLERYCQVPLYTIQHLLNIRRLLSEKSYEKVVHVMKTEFGYIPEPIFTKEQIEERMYLPIFN